MSQRDVWIQKTTAKLKEWNAELDQLQAKADAATADKRAALRERLDQMKAKRVELRSRLEEAKASSDEAWDELKSGANQAWAALSEAMVNARREIVR